MLFSAVALARRGWRLPQHLLQTVDRIEDLLVQFDQVGVPLTQAAIVFGQAAQAGSVGLGDGADAGLASLAPGEHGGRMARAAGLGAMARGVPAARLNLIDRALDQL